MRSACSFQGQHFSKDEIQNSLLINRSKLFFLWLDLFCFVFFMGRAVRSLYTPANSSCLLWLTSQNWCYSRCDITLLCCHVILFLWQWSHFSPSLPKTQLKFLASCWQWRGLVCYGDIIKSQWTIQLIMRVIPNKSGSHLIKLIQNPKNIRLRQLIPILPTYVFQKKEL